jgi:hypothetical protein
LIQDKVHAPDGIAGGRRPSLLAMHGRRMAPGPPPRSSSHLAQVYTNSSMDVPRTIGHEYAAFRRTSLYLRV